MHWNGGWHMGGMWFGWLAMGVLAIVVVWVLARGLFAHSASPPSGDSPEQALKKRLARGEIDRDEYEETLRELRK